MGGLRDIGDKHSSDCQILGRVICDPSSKDYSKEFCRIVVQRKEVVYVFRKSEIGIELFKRKQESGELHPSAVSDKWI